MSHLTLDRTKKRVRLNFSPNMWREVCKREGVITLSVGEAKTLRNMLDTALKEKTNGK